MSWFSAVLGNNASAQLEFKIELDIESVVPTQEVSVSTVEHIVKSREVLERFSDMAMFSAIAGFIVSSEEEEVFKPVESLIEVGIEPANIYFHITYFFE